MKKKKLNLDIITVESFITQMGKEAKTIAGADFRKPAKPILLKSINMCKDSELVMCPQSEISWCPYLDSLFVGCTHI